MFAAILAYWRRADVPGRRVDALAIMIFFAVAFGWSYFAARWGDVRLSANLPRIDGMVLVGFGPLLGAVVAGSIRRLATWPVGFRGLDKRWTMTALVVPIMVVAAFGVGRYHVEAHIDAAVVMISLVLASIGEEIGWREWLYNALAGWPLWASALATWLLWVIWHLAFVTIFAERYGIVYGPGYTAGLLVASLLLAAIARETRASASVAAWRAAAAADIPMIELLLIALPLAWLTWRGAASIRIRLSAAYPDNRPPTS